MRKLFLLIELSLIIISLILFSCGENKDDKPEEELDMKMNNIAESYVKLVLNIGLYDPDYVDAYYGPEDWKPKVKSQDADSTVIKSLGAECDRLLDGLENLGGYNADDLQKLRFKYLSKQLMAVKGKIFMLSGGGFSFDEEVRILYDASAPVHSNAYFEDIKAELDKLLPGTGDVQRRLEEFKKDFIIPIEKLDTVFTAAINECRKRTLNYIQLPPNENFRVEYVTDKPWGGYNWYKGSSYSIIQVNTDLPIYIDRAVDLAAHEGYPGHHVYNALLEKELVRKHRWIEYSVYPLYSPQSLIAEGTANYGIKAAFPGNSRIEFERQILFPLAGLDESKTDLYYKILELSYRLSYASVEAARNFIDGKWTKEETVSWLVNFGLSTRDRAERNLKFIEKYRSYIVNYSLGEDLVENYITRHGGTDDNPDLRWKLVERLLSTPQVTSNLK